MEELSIAQVEKDWNEIHPKVPFDAVFTQLLNMYFPKPFDGYTDEFRKAVHCTLQNIYKRKYCYNDLRGCMRFIYTWNESISTLSWLKQMRDDESFNEHLVCQGDEK